ncbi:hypothetical protein IX51_11410 [uncultured archaeon]|nr:hypothetical protein IX51_11410 [uncultured archaeon]
MRSQCYSNEKVQVSQAERILDKNFLTLPCMKVSGDYIHEGQNLHTFSFLIMLIIQQIYKISHNTELFRSAFQ